MHWLGCVGGIVVRLAATAKIGSGGACSVKWAQMRSRRMAVPVLQRKAGYREVFRWWLRFRTAAELSWEGGEELFHAGQRDVADLYEYWPSL